MKRLESYKRAYIERDRTLLLDLKRKDLNSNVLKIAINYVQICTILIKLDVHWPFQVYSSFHPVHPLTTCLDNGQL